MSYSIATAKNDLQGILHGTTLDSVTNVTNLFNRTARKLLLDIDPQETKVIAPLATPVYPIIFNYIIPTDLKGNKIIDIYPQIGRTPDNKILMTYNENFDLLKESHLPGTGTLVSDHGNKYLRLSYRQNTSSSLINSVGSITDNGTWAIGGVATNLTQNLMTNIGGQHSLQFDLGVGANTLTNSTMTAIDLTNSVDQTAILFKLYLPTVTGLTSVSFKFGSDAANYYQSSTLTSQFSTSPFVAGWNDVGEQWANCVQVGTPDVANIDYVEITINATVIISAIQVAQIWSSLGVMMDIEYYSRFIFQDISGAWKETTTDDGDTINLDTESYNLFLYLAALFCVQQCLGQMANFDAAFYAEQYQGALARYKRMYKSEILKPQQKYYTRTFAGYGNQLGTTLSHNQ